MGFSGGNSKAWTAAPFIPEEPTVRNLQIAAGGCTGCPLYKTGTQTVFGEGSPGARVMFIGEQPGSDEDLAGRPFVGPAGKLLNRCLEEAGIDREQVYVTNAVKHFKWEPAGKRRLHKKPGAREIAACRPWLEAEIAVLAPSVIVALGASGADPAGQGFSRDATTRATHSLAAGPARDRHGTSLLALASA